MTWRKSGRNTRMHLLEMRRSFVEDPRVCVEKQGKIRNGGQPKSRQQYVKRRKPGRLTIEKIKVNGNQPDGGMLHLYGQKKKAVKKVVEKDRNDMEADVYTKLDMDAGKNIIYDIVRHRNEYSNDVKGGTFI